MIIYYCIYFDNEDGQYGTEDTFKEAKKRAIELFSNYEHYKSIRIEKEIINESNNKTISKEIIWSINR